MSGEIKSGKVEKQEHKCHCGNDCKCGKKGSLLKAIITLLFCLITFGIGVFIGTQFMAEDRCVEENNNVVENEEVEKNELLSCIPDELSLDNYDIESYIEELLRTGVYLSIDTLGEDITDFSKLDNKTLLNLGFYLAEEDTIDSINESLTKYFGVTAKGEKITGVTDDGEELVVYEYNEETGKFTYIEENYYVLPEYRWVLNQISDISIKDNGEIVVKVYKAFAWGVHTGFDYNYYPTLKDLKDGTNLLFEADVVEMSNEDVYYTAGLDFRNVPKDKLYTYEYVFKINGDQLLLKSYRFYK